MLPINSTRAAFLGSGICVKRLRTDMESSDASVGPLAMDANSSEIIVRIVEDIKQEVKNLPDMLNLQTLSKTVHQLSEICKQDNCLDVAIKEGVVEVVVPLLSIPLPTCLRGCSGSLLQDTKRDACFILGLLAVKPDYQCLIASCGALPGIIKLMKEHDLTIRTLNQPGSGGVARKAADAITNLAHENAQIKDLVRENGGIQPLVALLDALDLKVQRAAAGALRTLAFKNEPNKNQIVEFGAVPVLIEMLRSNDVGIHYEAVGVIGNLVHSSSSIKKTVLKEGALQPVISLLSIGCPESQREAALLLGQFAAIDADVKVRIAQRGAIPPLIAMLSAPDITVREMAAFALGRLAQDGDNQAGIVHADGLPPLVDLLQTKHHLLQHNAAFALYGLSDNQDNIVEMMKLGVHFKLKACSDSLCVQASKDCVQKTLARMGLRISGDEEKKEFTRALRQAIFLLRSGDQSVKQRIVIALAELLSSTWIPRVFLEERGLDVLVSMLIQQDPKLQRAAAIAVTQIASKLRFTTAQCDAPPQPSKTVYLGVQFVNNPTLADVTFLVEERLFHAHRIALLASSDAFNAMFSQGFREKEAGTCIQIPNIPYEVFEDMMVYIYTGDLEVKPELAADLLQAADQYLLDGLKRLCEMSISNKLTVENVITNYDLAEAFLAPQLSKSCTLFVLEHYDEMVAVLSHAGFAELMTRMAQDLFRLRQTGTQEAAEKSGLVSPAPKSDDAATSRNRNNSPGP